MIKSKTLEKVKNLTYTCASCGSCYRGPDNPYKEEVAPNEMCPIYERFHFISHTKKGMAYLARKVCFEGTEIDDDFVHPYFTCTTCLTCDETCALPQLEIIKGMREEIALRRPEAIPKAILAINSNLSSKFNRFGSDQKKRAAWAADLNLPAKGDILYFAGCTAALSRTSLAQSIVKVSSSAGVNLAYLGEEEHCCGLLALFSGQPDIFKEMAKYNVEAIRKTGAKQVMVGCPVCYRALKAEYPEVVGELPFEVVHITEFLSALIADKKIGKLASKNIKVTYHDPCFLGRHMGVYEAPREVLGNIQGLDLVEMPRNKRFSWCCGSGAEVVAQGYREFANWTARQRLLEAESTRAEALVTSCPSCYQNFLVTKAREKDIQIEIRDLTDLVASCLVPPLQNV